MDEEQALIGQIGLLLTQLRYARRALEDIERSTARYGSIDFTGALAAGTRFGAPPLLDGALKVHVVNLNDLTTGGGISGFLENLLGGVGGFFGNFCSGLVGGAISGLRMPEVVGQIVQLADKLERIANTVNQILTTVENLAKLFADPSKPKQEGTGNSTVDLLQKLTELFRAAASGPQAEPPGGAGGAQAEGGNSWTAELHTINDLIQSTSRVIDGLIIVLPLLFGTLISLISHFDGIKLAILDMLEFALRNVFLLRGVILITIYDTLAGIANLVASLLGILKDMVVSVVGSIFQIIDTVVSAAIEVFRFLADGLQKTIDGLLKWAVEALAAVLNYLGETRAFRVIVHVIQMIPLIVPALYQLIYGEKIPLSTEEEGWLREAAKPLPAASGATVTGPVPLPSSPNLFPFSKDQTDKIHQTVTSAVVSVAKDAGNVVGALQTGISQASAELSKEASGATGIGEPFTKHLKELQEQAKPLAQSILQAEGQAKKGDAATGLEAIANAYEQWLGEGGGLNLVLGNITEYFRHTPTTGPEAADSLLGRILQTVLPGAGEQPRATIDIEEVIIEIGQPQATATEQPGATRVALTDSFVRELSNRLAELDQEDGMRGKYAVAYDNYIV
jgi:hypothetical protein